MQVLVNVHKFNLCACMCTSRCGIRGGYMQIVGLDDQVVEQIYKLLTVNLCPNTPGQVIILYFTYMHVATKYNITLLNSNTILYCIYSVFVWIP